MGDKDFYKYLLHITRKINISYVGLYFTGQHIVWTLASITISEVMDI